MTTPLHMQPLPAQPAIVRDWIASRNRTVRQVNKVITSAAHTSRYAQADRFADAMAAIDVQMAEFADLMAEATTAPPADVAKAWREWAASYNEIVNARNAERQARINARQVAAIVADRCPVCTSTHPGEC